ncbi:MAG: hypothetical protein AAGC55_30150, partial [Myxococcota bacterium]
RAALTTAADVVRGGGRAALHLASVAVRPDDGRASRRSSASRRRRGVPKVLGTAVDQPDSWLPGEPWSGLTMTAQLAATLPEHAIRSADGRPGFFVPHADVDGAAPSAARTRLIGCDDILHLAQDSFLSCVNERSPGLFTALGAAGLGKSRLADELAQRIRSAAPDAEIVTVRAAHTGGLSCAGGTAEIASALERGAERPIAVIIDDAHWADSETLQRVQYATLDHSGVARWVAALALPRLEETHSRWGSRANRHHRVVLEPLAEDRATELAAELLRPAEYPPTAFLRRLVRWSGGNPHLLTGLIAELKRRGVVRRHEHGDGWHVATAELEELPAQAAGQWLATRIITELPPELAACVRVCAVLGAAFSAAELSWIQDTVEARGGAGTTIDTEVGLSQLVARGILRPAGDGRYAFSSPAFQDGVYK